MNQLKCYCTKTTCDLLINKDAKQLLDLYKTDLINNYLYNTLSTEYHLSENAEYVLCEWQALLFCA